MLTTHPDSLYYNAAVAARPPVVIQKHINRLIIVGRDFPSR